ncbi:MAG: hypothetical protein GXY52_05220 [Chloroflexi bacterium]|nr:hypothetical protein [Chloroflexota bacterium]
MSDPNKVYHLTLTQFHKYLRDKVAEMKAAFRETEEIQKQFNDIFKRELEDWQKQFAYCFPRVLTERRELPDALRIKIDDAERIEHAKLEQELAELEQKIPQMQAESDQLLARAQQARDQLQTSNPQLNDAEEKLKQQLAATQDAYAALYEQIESLRRGLGGLFNAFKISSLKSQQNKLLKKRQQLQDRLQNTRNTWQQQLTETADHQSELRKQWEEQGIAKAEAQARRDFVQANLDGLAQQQGITNVLTNLDGPSGVAGELGTALDDLARRNQVRTNYEEGLRSVAEALGLTKGIAQGMERFAKSVAGVVEEQNRYNLSEVKLAIPQWVVNVAETWKPLTGAVKDEVYLGANPLEFSQIVKVYFSDRLNDDIIKAFFENMGVALNKATEAWK